MGGNGDSIRPDISPDNRYSTYASEATNLDLINTDINGFRDVFVRDMVTSGTINITVEWNWVSTSPSISDNGEFIAFHSNANNLDLVNSDVNGFADVYLYDKSTTVFKNITYFANGSSSAAHISADGKFITFLSNATNLWTGDSNPGSDVFLYDVDADTITNISYGQTNGNVNRPTICGDGSYVAFESTATDLTTGDANGLVDVFLYNRLTSTMTGITVHGNDYADTVYISDNCKYLIFEATSSNLVSGDVTHLPADTFVYDIATQTITLPISSIDLWYWNIQYSDISNDGRYLLITAFTGWARWYTTYDTLNDTFNYIASAGTSLFLPRISPDGRYVIFQSSIDTLVSGDLNAKVDIFIYDSRDTMPPVVTLSWSSGMVILVWNTFTDPGATWTDDVDGSGIVTIISGGTVDTNTPWIYVLEYVYVDSGGNLSNIATRIITVVDNTPPVVSIIWVTPLFVTLWNPFTDQGATWTDNVDWSGIITIATSGAVDINTVWTYILTYTYIDSSGNTWSAIRTVIVFKPQDWGQYNPTSIPTPNTSKDPIAPTEPTTPSQPIDMNEIMNPSISSDTCFSPLNKSTIDQGGMTEYQRLAHQMLYSYELTTIPGTKDFGPTRNLTRAEAAKFFVQFAENVLCRKKIQTYDNRFVDITGIHPDLQTNIKLSYEYGIFYGYKDGVFKPNDFISNDEIIAVMVRLVTNKYDDASGTNRAANYKKTLNNRTTVKLGNTLRGSIIQVVFNLYKENEYVLEDVGYVIK